MKERWSVLISVTVFVTLLAISVYPSFAWSVDLSVRENPYTLTPVNGILKDQLNESPAQPVAPTGELAVDDIKALHSGITPVSLSPGMGVPAAMQPAPTFVIIPVMDYGNNKAFSDVSVMFSTAVANILTDKMRQGGQPNAVLNPLYAYDEAKEKGLDGLYQRIVRDYREAGQPNEKDVLYLVEKLSNKRQQVEWVVFAHADFDSNALTRPTMMESALTTLYDRAPKEPNYFIKGRVDIYSTADGMPLIWQQAASSRVKMSQLGHFSRSVYDDSTSAYNFKTASSKLAQQLVAGVRPEVFASHKSVEAAIVPHGSDEPAIITPTDRALLKKIIEDNNSRPLPEAKKN